MYSQTLCSLLYVAVMYSVVVHLTKNKTNRLGKFESNNCKRNFFYSTHVSNVGNLNLEVIYIDLQWPPFISELTREFHCCFVKGQL